MAKKKTTSRQGKIPEGWAGQGLQLPRDMVKVFREESGDFGHGGVKVMGTAAMAVLLALDPEDRRTLCNYVWEKTRRDPGSLEKGRVLELLKMLLIDSQDDDVAPEVEPIWYVDKIVDPELSQPPGKKLSDKNKNQRRDNTA